MRGRSKVVQPILEYFPGRTLSSMDGYPGIHTQAYTHLVGPACNLDTCTCHVPLYHAGEWCTCACTAYQLPQSCPVRSALLPGLGHLTVRVLGCASHGASEQRASPPVSPDPLSAVVCAELRGGTSRTFRHLAMPESRPCACSLHGCLRHRTPVPTRWVLAHAACASTHLNAMQHA